MRSSDWSSDVCSSDLSFNGTVQVIGFIHDGRCNALKKLSYDAHGSTARNRTPTMPICRTADSTTAFGVALLSSMGRALVLHRQIGRASCRERVCQSVSISVVAVSVQNKQK